MESAEKVSVATSAAEGRRERAFVVARWALLSLAVALLSLHVFSNPRRIGWDAAAYLHWAEEMLRGGVPFVDIVDVNPPLVQFLHAPLALLARGSPLPAALTFNLVVLLAAGVSLYAFHAALRRLYPELTVERRFAATFAFAFAQHIAWAWGHFGQREHFIVLALVPALVVRSARHEARPVPNWTAVAAGTAIATSLAIKPHFAVAWGLFELAWLSRHRVWRRLFGREVYGFAAVVLVYAALFVVFPGMRREFFGHYLPLFSSGYAVYDCSLRDLFLPSELWAAGACSAVALARRPRAGEASLARPFGAFLLGCVLIYLLQHRGWQYHLLPAFSLAPLALVLFLPLSRGGLLASALGGLALSLAWHWESSGRPLREQKAMSILEETLRASTKPGDPALVLTTSTLGPYPALLDLGLRSGSRFAWLPLLPMFYPSNGEFGCRYRKWGEGLPAERRLLDDLASDIRTRRPVVIIASDRDSQALRPGCSASAWAEASGLVARAMSVYQAEPPVPGFRVWRLPGPARH